MPLKTCFLLCPSHYHHHLDHLHHHHHQQQPVIERFTDFLLRHFFSCGFFSAPHIQNCTAWIISRISNGGSYIVTCHLSESMCQIEGNAKKKEKKSRQPLQRKMEHHNLFLIPFPFITLLHILYLAARKKCNQLLQPTFFIPPIVSAERQGTSKNLGHFYSRKLCHL